MFPSKPAGYLFPNLNAEALWTIAIGFKVPSWELSDLPGAIALECFWLRLQTNSPSENLYEIKMRDNVAAGKLTAKGHEHPLRRVERVGVKGLAG